MPTKHLMDPNLCFYVTKIFYALNGIKRLLLDKHIDMWSTVYTLKVKIKPFSTLRSRILYKFCPRN